MSQRANERRKMEREKKHKKSNKYLKTLEVNGCLTKCLEKKSRPHDLETKQGIFREETNSAGYYYYTLVLN